MYGGRRYIRSFTPRCKAKEKASFDVFSQSRFSVRDFGDIPINREDIEKALKLCERTPSACNRQSQHIHIYLNKADVEKIGKLQMGCNGFYEDMQGAILVCSDMRFTISKSLIKHLLMVVSMQ